MSILDTEYKNKQGEREALVSKYKPTPEEKSLLFKIIKNFGDGYNIQRKPRREFNDLAVVDRMTIDQMLFNTYQPNDGDAPVADEIGGWKSRAMRPIVRNKVISIAAHATARLIFPKIFAQNRNSEEQADAANVMSELMEFAADQTDYTKLSMYSVINALVSPVSIVHTEYCEVYRKVKRPDLDNPGKYKEEDMLDEQLSGFQSTVVPMDEFFIEDFYEEDIQKQGWVIWRRVMTYSLAEAKYRARFENFEYVKPGVQTIYVDADENFYEVYDSNMRQNEVEEVLWWNKNDDLFIITINGVMMTPHDNPNPRNDKMYPFAKMIYEPLTNTKCFYGKSLVFKIAPDARIVNTLYPMIIDGTYLNLFPPMIAQGGEAISSDVIIPGAVTTLSSADANLKPITLANNISQGTNTLMQVEKSLGESSQEPVAGQAGGGTTTAYEISRIEQNAATVLGLFIKMIGKFVKDYGKLMMGDILQYMTIGEAKELEGDLVYKTFLFPDKQSEGGKMKTHKVMFDTNMPSEKITEKEHESMSFDVLNDEGGMDSELEIYKVNPELFRNLKYMIKISPDVLNPMSEDLERAFMLEEYDRAIQNPMLDQNAVTRDFLLSAYPKSKKDPDKYFKKEAESMGAQMGGMPMGSGGRSSPLQAMMGKKGLPQVPTAGEGMGGMTQ